MFGIGKWIRQQVADAMYEDRMGAPKSCDPLHLHGNSYISIHPISNGYLLQMNNNHIGQPTIVYCPDKQAISEQIVTLVARDRLGIPSDVKISGAGSYSIGSGGVGSTNFSQSI